MSLLKRLFGGAGAAPEAKPEEYKGFAITPQPAKVDGGYRIGAMISMGEKEHTLIRADTIADPDLAREASITKAKQVIDEQGERIFG